MTNFFTSGLVKYSAIAETTRNTVICTHRFAPSMAVTIAKSAPMANQTETIPTVTASITRNTTIAIIQKVVIDISANIGIVITSTLVILL